MMKLEWFGAVLNVEAIKSAIKSDADPNIFIEDKKPHVLTETEILEEELSKLKEQRSDFISQSTQNHKLRSQLIGLTHLISCHERRLKELMEAQKKKRNWKVTPLTKAMCSQDIQKISVVQSLLEAKADVNLIFLDNMPLFGPLEQYQGSNFHEKLKLSLNLLLKLLEIWPKKDMGHFFLQKIWIKDDLGACLYLLNLIFPYPVSDLIYDYAFNYAPSLELDCIRPFYTALLGYFFIAKTRELEILNLLNLQVLAPISSLILEYFDSPTNTYLKTALDRLSAILPSATGMREQLICKSVLSDAAYCGDLSKMKTLIEAKADITAQEEGTDLTILDYAIRGPRGGSHTEETVKYITTVLSNSYQTLFNGKTEKHQNKIVTSTAITASAGLAS